MNPLGDKSGGVDLNDINVDVEPVADTPAKMIDDSPTPKEKEEAPAKASASDVYGRPVTTLRLYSNAFRYYTRIGSMIFSGHSGSMRPVKALNTFAQLTIAMCIVCSIMGPLGIEYEMKALASSFWAMRLLSPIMFFLESCGAKSGKFAVVIVSVAFFAIFITG
jgi:hypothetical protein